MNRISREKQLAVIAALVEGSSVRSVERMTGVHRDTILRLLVRVGERCEGILDATMRDVRCRSLQIDELWCYVQKKQARVRPEERGKGYGDQYVFVAIDPESKLIPAYLIGKRDLVSTERFLEELYERLAETGRIQVTTDGLMHYRESVGIVFGPGVDFAQQVKLYASVHPGPGRYAPPRVSEVISTVIVGDPDPNLVCTSHVERQNLTMRMSMRRFTRLTNGFSKKLANLSAAVALHFAWYNLVRIHRSLRVTPAMAAHLTDRVWTMADLLPV